MTVAGGRRYALLLALHDSDYVKNAYGGYRNVFLHALRSGTDDETNGNETWDCFRVIDGEFPATEDLHLYDGFVVSGSPHDAHGDGAPGWVRRLCALLRAVHAMGACLLGVCFGHQLLCRALGGTVGRASGGWDVGVRKITFVEDQDGGGELAGLEFLRGQLGRGRSSGASIIEVHQDEVWELPPGGKVLAYSEKTRVEVFAVGDSVLGIQGHPEYGSDILLNLVGRLAGQDAIDVRTAEEARGTAESGGPDREFWTGLCKAFLRGGGGGGGRTQAGAAEMSCSQHVFVAPFPAGTAVGL